jgi:soluble cytochrome b562
MDPNPNQLWTAEQASELVSQQRELVSEMQKTLTKHVDNSDVSWRDFREGVAALTQAIDKLATLDGLAADKASAGSVVESGSALVELLQRMVRQAEERAEVEARQAELLRETAGLLKL